MPLTMLQIQTLRGHMGFCKKGANKARRDRQRSMGGWCWERGQVQRAPCVHGHLVLLMCVTNCPNPEHIVDSPSIRPSASAGVMHGSNVSSNHRYDMPKGPHVATMDPHELPATGMLGLRMPSCVCRTSITPKKNGMRNPAPLHAFPCVCGGCTHGTGLATALAA